MPFLAHFLNWNAEDYPVSKSNLTHLRLPIHLLARWLKWLAATGARTPYIELGFLWENGYGESFNSKQSDEFLNAKTSSR